jgi:hypothetical protein
MRTAHEAFIHGLNTGPLFNEKVYNPDEWLRMYRVYGTWSYLTAHLRSFAYWVKVNGRWLLK